MDRLVVLRRVLGASLVMLLLPAAAEAGVRYTAPTATATSGDCSSPALPCRIDHAVNAANGGDEVVVAPGTYAITIPLDPPDIDLHGAAGAPAPVLAGDVNLVGSVLTLDGGGSVRHLALTADAPAHDALVLRDALGEDLSIVARAGDGAKVETAAATTVLRDSVIVHEDSRSGAAALKLREGSGGAGSIAVRNVTALAPSATAVRCEVRSPQTATIVNVIARGSVADADASNGGTGCSASHSSLRPAGAPAMTLGAGIVTADPLLGADFRPLAGSPTVDAGAADALTTAADPDGRARTVPDIGAYEGPSSGGGAVLAPTPAPAPEPAVTPEPRVEPPVRGIPAPVLGETVVVAPGRGKVLVRRPGARRFRRLARPGLLPTGTVVDARRGRIRLHTALDEAGRFQSGRFWGSRFQIRQSAAGGGMTSLALRGGDFGRCPARASRTPLARTSAVPPENSTTRRVVRRLWSRDRGGRFRTYGNNSVATARGTRWVTADRCDGTVVRVREGAVAVKNRRTGRTVLVRAGAAYLARR